MKQQNLFAALLSLVLTLTFIGCSKNNDNNPEVHPIRFPNSSYEARIGVNEYLSFVDGSGNYTLTVENPELLDASINLNSKNVVIHGKKKGETLLHITDHDAGKSVKLKIAITDGYIGFLVIGYRENHHPVFIPDTHLFLVKNANSDFYLFSKDNVTNKPLLEGQYSIEIENQAPYISFYYTDNATQERAKLRFNFSKSSPEVINFLNHFLELGWTANSKSTKALPATPYFLRLRESENDPYATDCVMQAALQLPAGFLQ